MLRLILTIILPFLLPLLLFFFYWFFSKNKKQGVPIVPWFWLLIAGILLSIVTLIALEMTDHSPEMNKTYRPSQIIDGVIVPGGFVPVQSPENIK